MESALDYRIYKSYQLHQKIGKGAYGQVYRATNKKTQKQVAIKKIFDVFQNLTDAKRTYRELAYLIQLSHPCIIKLQRVISGELEQNQPSRPNKNVYAVFELMEMDLAKTLHLCKLEPLQRKFIALQILSALNYLHDSGLVHRDIKPSNILLDSSCNTKICDFGLVRKISDFTERDKSQQIFTEYVASRWYRAPEILLNGNHFSTIEIDMWSFGCVLAEMILGYPIFQGKNTLEQLQIIFSRIGMPIQQEIENVGSEQGKFLLKNFHHLRKESIREILIGATPEEIDFIQKILVFNPKKRLTASQALKHPYFHELRSEVPTFHQPPVKIHDNSLYLQDSGSMLDKYRQLIESLCINTFRTSNSSSSKAIKYQNSSNYKQYRKYLQKPEEKMNLKQEFEVFTINKKQNKEKSTRSSNCGTKQQSQKVYTSSDRSNKQIHEKSVIRHQSNFSISEYPQTQTLLKSSQNKGRSKSKSKTKTKTVNRNSITKPASPKETNKSLHSTGNKSKSKLVLNPKSKSRPKKVLQKCASMMIEGSHSKIILQPEKMMKKYRQESGNKGGTKLVKKRKKIE